MKWVLIGVELAVVVTLFVVLPAVVDYTILYKYSVCDNIICRFVTIINHYYEVFLYFKHFIQTVFSLSFVIPLYAMLSIKMGWVFDRLAELNFRRVCIQLF